MKKISLVIIMGLIVVGSFVFMVFYVGGLTGNVIFESEDKREFEEGFVGKVIDGDTVIIDGESVRLLGMDTDERGYDCYKEAKTRMEELVLNRDVRMEKDKTDKDQYKRYLRYLFVEVDDGNEVNVNLKMVEEGMAIARFYDDRKYSREILEAEKIARENRIGCKWRDL